MATCGERRSVKSCGMYKASCAQREADKNGSLREGIRLSMSTARGNMLFTDDLN